MPVMLNSDSDNQFFKIVNKKFHSAYIDSIGFINDNILSKDVNGHIYLWELESENVKIIIFLLLFIIYWD